MDHRGNYVGNGLSFLSGLGVGAVVMYLLDPEEGQNRRSSLRTHAGEMIQHTGEWIGSTAGSAAEHGRHLSEHLGHHLSHLRPAASVLSRGSGWTDTARNYLNKPIEYLRKPLAHLRKDEPVSPGLTIAAAAAGVLAVGTALYFLLEPRRGPSRRAAIRRGTRRMVQQTTEPIRRGGRFVADKAGSIMGRSGRFSDAAVEDDRLNRDIRRALATRSEFAAVGIQSCQGHVELTGLVAPSLREELVRLVRGVPGVVVVEERFSGSTGPSDTSTLPHRTA